MTVLLLSILFGALALALFGLGAAWLAPASATGTRLREMLGVPAPKKAALGERLQQALSPAARLLPPSADEVSRTRQWLIQAGFREPRQVHLFFGIRALLVMAPVPIVLATGWARQAPLLLVALPLLGWMLPRVALKRLIRQRAQRVRLSLPDVLDLLVICVEAGLGLDAAVQRVAEELKVLHPDLAGELELLTLEMRAGVARPEALRHLSQRCDVDDLRGLAAVLIQSDRFGTSIAQVLRVHSDALRTERRQRAEEAAAKLSIKMLPVLALFIFPAVMIVVIGPAVIALVRHLGPVLAQ